jgi:hypothetical protein
MADYYPLIARAIAGLDPNAPGESRRALYERARTALIAQLRSVQPPLSESEITRERLSLERPCARSNQKPPSAPARRRGPAAAERPPRAGATLSAAPMPGRRNPQALRAPARLAAPRPPRLQPPSREAVPPLGQDEQRPPRNLPARFAAAGAPRPQPPQIPMQDAGPAATAPARQRAPARGPENGGPPAAASPPGMRGFRDIAADADDLGRAAAQANRNARKTYANVPSPSPEFDRLEPSMENRGADPDAPYSYDESLARSRPLRARKPPQPPSRERSRLSQDRDREPKKPRARTGTVFPFKSAIAVGIVLILVGCRHPVGQVGGHGRERPVQILTCGGSAEGSGSTPVAPEDPRSRRPAVVERQRGAGGAARRAV